MEGDQTGQEEQPTNPEEESVDAPQHEAPTEDQGQQVPQNESPTAETAPEATPIDAGTPIDDTSPGGTTGGTTTL